MGLRAGDVRLFALAALVVYGQPTDLKTPVSAPKTKIVADHEGALAEVVIHYTPRAKHSVLATYRDILRALEPGVVVWVVAKNRAHFDEFVSWANKARKAQRRYARGVSFRPVLTGRPMTTWSRDRFTLLEQARSSSHLGDRRVLLVRHRPHQAPAARKNDWYAPFALANAAGPSVVVKKAPLIFDGGDLIATRTHVFATSLLLARNVAGSLGELSSLRRWLRRTTSRKVVLLGKRPGDVPQHHVGMFMTPISEDTILVGDVKAGLSILPKNARLPLPVDRRPSTIARFERVASDLKAAGFVVVRVPLVPLRDEVTFLTYNNAVIERRKDGKLHALVPQFGIPALDAAGRAVYRSRAIVVHPIDVSRIYQLSGTVRCLLNVAKRTKPHPQRAEHSS
jgi:hypothetical protein